MMSEAVRTIAILVGISVPVASTVIYTAKPAVTKEFPSAKYLQEEMKELEKEFFKLRRST